MCVQGVCAGCACVVRVQCACTARAVRVQCACPPILTCRWGCAQSTPLRETPLDDSSLDTPPDLEPAEERSREEGGAHLQIGREARG